VKLLRRAVQLAPTEAASWYQLATSASGSGRITEALEQLEKTVKLDSVLPGAYTTMAATRAAAGQSGAAQDALREALRIDPYDAALKANPNMAEAHVLRGRLLVQSGNYRKRRLSTAKPFACALISREPAWIWRRFWPL
jgi:tetratricopeptide (TPR) repeat protein